MSGQYTKGEGKDKEGYLEHEDVENKDSKTETFSSVVFYVDTPRWQGVPFILKAGKGMSRRAVRKDIR